MEDFLKSRNVPPEIIQKLKDEGIDEHVLTKIEINQLQRYLPKYGDCLAVTFFAKQRCTERSKETKRSLRDRLVSKIQRKNNEHGRRSASQEGNMNAKKGTKRIELGWLHENGSGLKQVRSPNGGGTRNVDMDLDGNLSTLLDKAKDLFFPNGTSKKGPVTNFDFYIADQTHRELDLDITLRHVIESTHLKSVRFYMVTASHYDDNDKLEREVGVAQPVKRVKTVSSETETVTKETDSFKAADSDDSFADAMNDDISSDSDGGRSQNLVKLPAQIKAARMFKKTTSVDNLLKDTIDEPRNMQSVEELSENKLDPMELFDFYVLGESGDILEQAMLESTVFPNSGDSTQHAEPPGIENTYEEGSLKCLNISLHRTLIQKEMLSYFKNPEITDTKLSISFINEKGQDADGVSRDAYSGFWESFYQRNTDGETYRVPILVNDYSQEEWGAVGRIFLKGFEDHRYFPINLAPAFTVSLILGEHFINPSVLKDSFLLFLSTSEKDVLQQAIDNLEYDKDELLGVLDRFQAHIIPMPDQLNSFIQQAAHRVIIQEPKYAVDSMKVVCETRLKQLLPDVESILKLYASLKTSIPKVLQLLKATPLSKEDNMALEYLKRFIRGRNTEQLKRLLRLLTGSDIISVSEIVVSFVVRHGAQRIPTMHTCGPSLELPSTYVSFPDFRSEWENIMDNSESFKMQIA